MLFNHFNLIKHNMSSYYVLIFNLPGVKPAICCSLCKKEGMINVKCKRCTCGIQAGYNYPGNKLGIYCFKCKKEGMIDVVNPKCKSDFCDTYSSKKYKSIIFYQ